MTGRASHCVGEPFAARDNRRQDTSPADERARSGSPEQSTREWVSVSDSRTARTALLRPPRRAPTRVREPAKGWLRLGGWPGLLLAVSRRSMHRALDRWGGTASDHAGLIGRLRKREPDWPATNSNRQRRQRRCRLAGRVPESIKVGPVCSRPAEAQPERVASTMRGDLQGLAPHAAHRLPFVEQRLELGCGSVTAIAVQARARGGALLAGLVHPRAAHRNDGQAAGAAVGQADSDRVVTVKGDPAGGGDPSQ
jgi:hypothetical protein